ncbi:hypothetical protein HIM_06902 [Hirsutella minnesotensis 3608]|uniref:Amidoligase enzyme n=1 Tax=Hirsutella minnesotensis 3608 TaxID=1043627 RepID=A0A0F8A4L4_9HYPO|nr:hypothetical protein HIM_06902 [Hirsutella minnesotensis 3608]
MTASRVGLELEFMVPCKLGDPKSPGKLPDTSSDQRWPDSPGVQGRSNDSFFANTLCQKAVCHALANCGLPVARTVFFKPLSGDPDSRDTNHAAISIGPSHRLLVWNRKPDASAGRQERFRYWYVTYEPSILHALDTKHIKGPGPYQWYAMEINSPILSAPEEFAANLPTVAKALSSIRNSTKVWLNAECGLHIHVSPPNGPLDINVARRLAALTLLMERPFLLKLCHPCRQRSLHVPLISTHSTIAVDASTPTKEIVMTGTEAKLLCQIRATARNRSRDEPQIFRMLGVILAQPDGISLRQKMRTPDPGVISLSACSGRCALAVSDFGTMEFRYPQASFDVDFISLWVDIVRRMFAIAASPDATFLPKLAEFYDMATSNIQLGWIHWLRALGLAERAEFCKRQINRYGGDLKDLNKGGILPLV